MKYLVVTVFWICFTALAITHMVIQHIEDRQCVDRGGVVDRNFFLQNDCEGMK